MLLGPINLQFGPRIDVLPQRIYQGEPSLIIMNVFVGEDALAAVDLDKLFARMLGFGGGMVSPLGLLDVALGGSWGDILVGREVWRELADGYGVSFEPGPESVHVQILWEI